MSKAKQITLSVTGKSEIVAAYVGATEQMERSGNLVLNVANVCQKHMKGAAIPDAEIDGIAQEIATNKGWTGASLKVRLSNVSVVLRQYPKLIEAHAAVIKETGGKIGYHDMQSMASKLNKGKEVKEVVQAMLTPTERVTDGRARTAGALRSWYKQLETAGNETEMEAIRSVLGTLKIYNAGWAQPKAK